MLSTEKNVGNIYFTENLGKDKTVLWTSATDSNGLLTRV